MRCRLVAVAVGLAGVLATGTVAPARASSAAPPPASSSGDDVGALEARGSALQATRAELLGRIAALSDRADAAQAALVAARRRSREVAAAAAGARDAFVEHAVQAFVHAGTMPEAARARGGIFTEVVADVDRAVVDALAGAEAAATVEHDAAEGALADARRTGAEVAATRAALEATIATNEAQTEAARAEAARNALARRLAEEQEAARAAAARAAEEASERAAGAEAARSAGARAGGRSTVVEAGGAPAGGYSARQLDRFARATAAEAALMAAHPFGPVAGLPPGVTLSGAVVEGQASWYGPGFDGRPTASGALYDQQGWTVASKELPLGTVLLVTRGDRSVLVLVNDRGPYVVGRVLDLSRGVAEALGTIGPGVAHVRAEVVRLP